MKDFLKILLPAVLSIFVLSWGVNSQSDEEEREQREKPHAIIEYPSPETFTISQYQKADVKDGLEWFKDNWKHKFLKSDKIYGILKFEGGKWQRSGRWYFFVDKKLLKSTSFQYDKKDGNELFYNRYGFLKDQRAYKAGLKHGKSATYNSKGDLSEFFCFEEGQEVDCAPFVGCEPKRRNKTGVIIENQ